MRNRLLHISLLLLAAIALYANSLPNSFNFDDQALLIDNNAVHGITAANLKAVFTSVPNHLEYLPVRDLTYMLDYQIWGLDPLGYHITNLIFYLLCVIMFYLFMAEILAGAGGAAFAAALVYALHPVHVESVASITQRNNLVSGFFYFTGLFLYMRHKRHGATGSGYYLLSLLSFVLAMLSKAIAVVLPVTAVLLELYFPDEDPLGKRLSRTVPFFILAAGFSVLDIEVAKSTRIFLGFAAGLASRLPGAFEAVWAYIKMLLFPYQLKVWHSFNLPAGFLDPRALLSMAGLAALIFLIIYYRKRYRVLSFAAAWMLTSMAPVAGLVPAATIIAERYAFLPSAGFCLSVAFIFMEIYKNRAAQVRLAAVLAAAAVLISYAVTSFQRNFEWKDQTTLLEADLNHHPDLLKTYVFLGRAYVFKGDYQKGLYYLLQAKRINPGLLEYDFFSAYYLYKTGQLDAALEALKSLRKNIGGEVIDIDYLCGRIYELKGDDGKARDYYLKAADADIPMGIYLRQDALDALKKLGAS
ncbi:MAG: glycosyltransferase family 39 protein [Nitrospiraceae bacterium]|nr:glycosyltransferase family 39 protein [Nitrospiraceae bacterium]